MKCSIFLRGNSILGYVGGLEPSWSPWREKKDKTKCSYRRVEKKLAPERRFFIKKETLLLEGAFV